ncbi:MAG: hypothetical protein K9L30_17120 [Desulfobacterales bacterium]|nr:hypothetical protein [Desulfobacterales bacterium]
MPDEQKPECFSCLDKIFPMGENDFRSTPVSCEPCPYKLECLKAAIDGPDGLKLKEEYIDRAYKSGLIGFVERWAKKKAIRRKMKQYKNTDN